MLSGNQFEYVLTENVLKSFTPKISVCCIIMYIHVYHTVVSFLDFHSYNPILALQASDGDSSSSFNTLSFEINGIGTESPYDQWVNYT